VCVVENRFYNLETKNMAESRKPNKLYATHPSNYGKGSRACRVTGRLGGMGLVRKYGINMKRQVFRERARDMGFEKYN
jgi:small subunit ribosomal protein S29e